MHKVVFSPSGLRHGYTEEDFYELLAGHYLKVRSQKGIEDVYELLGQNLSGDDLRVVYRVMSDGAFRVFHIGRMIEKEKRRYRRARR